MKNTETKEKGNQQPNQKNYLKEEIHVFENRFSLSKIDNDGAVLKQQEWKTIKVELHILYQPDPMFYIDFSEAFDAKLHFINILQGNLIGTDVDMCNSFKQFWQWINAITSFAQDRLLESAIGQTAR